MPYKSRAQQRLFHVLEKQGEISHKVVNEWDQASEGKKLPDHIKPRGKHKSPEVVPYKKVVRP